MTNEKYNAQNQTNLLEEVKGGIRKMETKQNKRKVVVAYRNNDLFGKYMPEVASTLSEQYDVQLITFPRGTTKEAIAESFKGKTNGLETLVISDRTVDCQGLTSSGLCYDEKGQRERIQNGIDLDRVLNRVLFPFEVPHDNSSAWNQECFDYIIAQLKQKPRKIYLLTENILDHTEFWNGYISYPDRKSERLAEIGFSQQIAERLKKAGIPDVTIVRDIDDFPDSEENPEANSWVLGDRHYPGLRCSYAENKLANRVYPLPCSDFFEALLHKGMVNSKRPEGEVLKEFKEELFRIAKDYFEKVDKFKIRE